MNRTTALEATEEALSGAKKLPATTANMILIRLAVLVSNLIKEKYE